MLRNMIRRPRGGQNYSLCRQHEKGATAAGALPLLRIWSGQKSLPESLPDWQQARSAAVSASSMMRRMVLAHRPHWGLQPKQPYTSPAVRGAAILPASVPRTSWSLSTLQEHTIIADSRGRWIGINCNYRYLERAKVDFNQNRISLERF
jgi:hypothetical protein